VGNVGVVLGFSEKRGENVGNCRLQSPLISAILNSVILSLYRGGMPQLRMEFLGGFRVTHDGNPLTNFESSKVRALLAYLATDSQRPHPRESLAALL
jgi:hypothetical protein